MERITERYELTVRALAKFHELASRQNLTEIERDALMQRFEFTFELTWKCAKEYLYRVNAYQYGQRLGRRQLQDSREVGADRFVLARSQVRGRTGGRKRCDRDLARAFGRR